MGRICIIEACDTVISERSRLDVCPACRQNLCSWDKRHPAEIMEYKAKLTKRRARMVSLVADEVRDTTKRGVIAPKPNAPIYRLTRNKFVPINKSVSITGGNGLRAKH